MQLSAAQGKAILSLYPEKTHDSNGLIIPKQFRKKAVKAKVVGYTDIEGVEDGDIVFLAPDSGYSVDYEGDTYVVVQKYEILVKLNK